MYIFMTLVHALAQSEVLRHQPAHCRSIVTSES